tara:strand:- start:1056 stop:2099 length:1044 start_codon:yes stop_codon:yes gene_type:complete
MAGYIGGKVAISSPQQIETKHTVTATASQTSITNVGYTVGAVHVYQNGVRLVDGTDYTATNGSTITLSTGATENDQIVIVSHGSFETADTVSKASGGTFSGNVTVSGNVTATGSVTANSLVVPDGSIPLVDLDIDGGTDIGAALVDADLMVVDDGAGGTNRKATMSRLATYMGTKIGGLKEFIVSSGSISNAATQSFTQFDSSKYVHYEFEFRNVIPVDDNVQLYARTSSNGGSSYDSGSDHYHTLGSTTGVTAIHNIAPETVGSASGELGVSLVVECRSPHITSSHTHVISGGGVSEGTTGFYYSGYYATYGGSRIATANVNAAQFFFSSGNIESGEIRMYGIKES